MWFTTWLAAVGTAVGGELVAVAEDDPNQSLSHETTWPSMVAVTKTVDGLAPKVLPK